MDSNYLITPLVFLIQVLFGAYTLVVMLRFLLQYVRADFYNPLSQFIVKVTSPVLHPLRRVIPSVGKMDVSSLVFAWLLKAVELILILLVMGHGLNLIGPLLWAIPELVMLTINIFLFSILILVIASWVAPGNYNPALSLLGSLTDPIMRPARRLIPPISGLDLSPMVVIIGLYLLEMLLIPPLRYITGSPF
jgi:YggT family protein